MTESLAKAADGRDQPVSVIIPALNCGSVIGVQLEALAKEAVASRLEVIVADNGSTDDTREVARSFANRLDLRLIDASARSRAAFARNVGAAAAAHDLLLFLDADDEVCPGYVGAMKAALGSADIVGGLLDLDALNTGAAARRDVPQVSSLPSGLFPWSYSCALGVRRDLFLRIGGFEEQLWNGEDVDFCWRSQMAGGRMALAHGAVVRYRVPSDVQSLYRQGRNYGRGGSQVERRYADLGMTSSSSPALVRQTITLLLRLATSRDRNVRGRMAFLVGRRVGLLHDRVRPLPIAPVGPDGRRRQ